MTGCTAAALSANPSAQLPADQFHDPPSRLMTWSTCSIVTNPMLPWREHLAPDSGRRHRRWHAADALAWQNQEASSNAATEINEVARRAALAKGTTMRTYLCVKREAAARGRCAEHSPKMSKHGLEQPKLCDLRQNGNLRDVQSFACR